MSDTQNPGGWPDAAWSGVPPNPERDGWHWVDGPENKNPVVLIWHTLTQNWVLGAIGLPPSSLAGAIYLGPALTPAEVEAREAAARRERDEARAALLEARREGFLAALEMAERRCEDAARYVRLRARSGEDHTVASTYEQAGAMVRALPVPEVFRVPTGLEYRGG